ncbi:TonB-dependent receptor domain-containing protein [Colwellia sp. RE-S-Sl-9]
MKHRKHNQSNYPLKTLIAIGCGISSFSALADEHKNIEHMVVTATGNEHVAITAPASISVLTPEDIERMPIKDIGDALRGLAGVSITNWAGGRNEINLRGLDEDYVLMLVDGKRVSSSNGLWRGGNFDNTSIPLSSISSVEVVRGPMSALYGSDAVGGVINIITKSPSKEWKTTVSAESGFMSKGDGGDRYRANVYTSGQINDELSLTFSAEKAEQDFWNYDKVTPNHDTIEKRETLKFSTSLQWNISKNQSIDFDLSKDEDEVPPTNYGGAIREQSIDRLTFGITHKAEFDWGGTQVLINRSEADLYDYNSRYNLQPPLGRDIKETFTTARGTVFLPLDKHDITLGAEYLDTEIDDPVQYPETGGDSISLTSVFAQDEIQLGESLIATLGARIENSEEYGTHTSPRAYLVYSINDDVVIKGGVGKAFRAPTLFESSKSFGSVSCAGACTVQGNPDLKEETSTNTELSVLVNKENWSMSATIFNNTVKNLIAVSAWDGVSPSRLYFNSTEVDLQGLELMASAALSETVSVDLNYSYLTTEDENGQSLPYRPENTGNVKVSWQVIDSVSLYTNVNYYGEHLNSRTEEMSGYSLVDLGVNYKVSNAIQLRAGMANVTDEQPVLDEPTSEAILQGRSLFIGGTFSF